MKFALQFIEGQRNGETFPLVSNSITIGRSVGEILSEDAGISGKHCSIQMNGGELFVVDHASRNGTTVNGERIERKRLKAGDVVQAGQLVFRIVEWTQPMAFQDPIAMVKSWCEQVSGLDKNAPTQLISTSVEKELGFCLSDLQLKLIVESKDGRIIHHMVPAGEVVLGRVGHIPLIAEDDEVSRKHARIYSSETGELYAEDLGSANGTFVNEEKVVGRIQLHSGDVVRCGRTNVRVSAVIAEFTDAIQL